jgi:tRNA dimethylallyltransferase
LTNRNLITILGPTASGKTRLAAQVAYQLGGEVISADSRQVYQQMNIGTGKDLSEYIIDNRPIPYHLIDIVAAGGDYNLYQYQQDFERVYADIQQRHATPILCGGSGLYIQAVLQDYQFDSYQLSVINNAKIQPKNFTNNVFGLSLPLELRRERITKRLHQRLNEGMIDEVRGLMAAGVSAEKLIYYGLEYKFIAQYLIGDWGYETMVERLNIAIHQFAKRQMTYFRKMEKDGIEIQWLDATLPLEKLVESVLELLK